MNNLATGFVCFGLSFAFATHCALADQIGRYDATSPRNRH